jgi:hypothetical protein
MVTDRIAVVAGEGGEGEVWWCFRSDDGTWLVFENGQWNDFDPLRTWNSDVRVGVDGHHTVVSIENSGVPIVVERHDLQPPDFMPTPDTVF